MDKREITILFLKKKKKKKILDRERKKRRNEETMKTIWTLKRKRLNLILFTVCQFLYLITTMSVLHIVDIQCALASPDDDDLKAPEPDLDETPKEFSFSDETPLIEDVLLQLDSAEEKGIEALTEQLVQDGLKLLSFEFGVPVGVIQSFLSVASSANIIPDLTSLFAPTQVSENDADDVGVDNAGDLYNNATKTLCETSSCCFMGESDDERCSFPQINAMVENDVDDGLIDSAPDYGSVVVFPGGETSCIFKDSTAFGFQVWPGLSSKLLMYFQGGGACWNQVTTDVVTLCLSNSEPIGQSGVFNRTDISNPFREYTIVHLLYCSGDLFIGNVTQSYLGKDGGRVSQTGAYNTEAVLSWIVEQQSNNYFDTFEDLVIMGCSAGSLGAQFWSTTILDRCAKCIL